MDCVLGCNAIVDYHDKALNVKVNIIYKYLHIEVRERKAFLWCIVHAEHIIHIQTA